MRHRASRQRMVIAQAATAITVATAQMAMTMVWRI
jgi:hypothetical protein